MTFILKILLSSSFYGVLGYIVSLMLVVFNKYVSYILSSQVQHSDNLNFIGIILYLINNRLTENDFIFSVFGFVFFFFLGLLRGFQKERVY